jgi:hypothetical protein
VGDVLGRAWEIYTEQFGMCFGLVCVALLINLGFSSLAGVFPLVGLIASILFSVWIYIGVAVGLLQVSRGQATSLDVIFKGGPYFGRILLASILYGLMIQGIFLILFAPGLAVVLLAMRGAEIPVIAVSAVALGLLPTIPALIVALTYSQFYYLIVDRDVGIFESFALSRQVTAGNRLSLLAVWGMVALINLLGALACCVGLLFTVPLAALVNVVVYLAMTGQPTAGQQYLARAEGPSGAGTDNWPAGP